MMEKMVVVPEEQFKQLEILGKVLGIDANDMLELRNLRNYSQEIKDLHSKVDNLTEQNTVLRGLVGEIGDFLNQKQDDYFDGLYSRLTSIIGGVGNE